MRNTAEGMLRDLAAATRRHAGVQHLIRNQARLANLDLDLALDPDFEAVYPGPDSYQPEDLERIGKDLARRLRDLSPEDLGEWLAGIEAEARIAGFQSHSFALPTACNELARVVPDPLAVAAVMVKLKLPEDVVQPFLLKAAQEGVSGWIPFVEGCLDEGAYAALAASTSHSASCASTAPAVSGNSEGRRDAANTRSIVSARAGARRNATDAVPRR